MPDPLTGLYFDGRKDKTKVKVKKGTKNYPSTVIEEYITLVQEPRSKYIGHLALSAGDSQSIEEGIVGFYEKKAITFADLAVVGCDGTQVNTVALGGVIRLMELELGRPLQWLVCKLHAYELLL